MESLQTCDGRLIACRAMLTVTCSSLHVYDKATSRERVLETIMYILNRLKKKLIPDNRLRLLIQPGKPWKISGNTTLLVLEQFGALSVA